jgi:hypothetical protein
MRKLSEEGRRALTGIAERYGVSLSAVEHLLSALIAGQATQAQFNHPDLGGMGQWSQGGMIMVGDMFNNGLKAKVSDICSELAALVRGSDLLMSSTSHQSQYQGGTSLFVPGELSSRNWWPEELGYASSTGAQNDLRYAFFPASRRLAIDIGGKITVYDTRDNQITGFSQQQGGDQSLSFTSQYGLVKISDLDVMPPEKDQAPVAAANQPEPAAAAVSSFPASSFMEPQRLHPEPSPEKQTAQPTEDIFDKIERLAALHAKGILTDEEFQVKKKELLDRL